MPLTGIPGQPPDLSRAQPGCWFAPRCPQVMDRCASTPPELYPVDRTLVRCLRYDGTPPDPAVTAGAVQDSAGVTRGSAGVTRGREQR